MISSIIPIRRNCIKLLLHFALCFIMLYHVASCCIVLHRVAICCILLPHIVSSCIMLYHALLCITSTIQYSKGRFSSTLPLPCIECTALSSLISNTSPACILFLFHPCSNCIFPVLCFFSAFPLLVLYLYFTCFLPVFF